MEISKGHLRLIGKLHLLPQLEIASKLLVRERQKHHGRRSLQHCRLTIIPSFLTSEGKTDVRLTYNDTMVLMHQDHGVVLFSSTCVFCIIMKFLRQVHQQMPKI